MTNENDYLVIEKIQSTIDKLYLRISDRFPKSGLSKICKNLHNKSLETNKALEWIAKPIVTIRIIFFNSKSVKEILEKLLILKIFKKLFLHRL